MLGVAVFALVCSVGVLSVQVKPLVRPYALWTGNIFRGVMQKWDAKTQAYVPVPNAMIGVVFPNHKIDMENNKFEKEARVDSPNDTCSLQRIMANEDGNFLILCQNLVGGDFQL